MQHVLAHHEATDGKVPRHPIVCLIDIAGFAITLLLLVVYPAKPMVALLPIAMLLQYAISCTYHWVPRNDTWQRIDQGMIVLLVAATYAPFWSTLADTSELWWRAPVLALLTGTTLLFRCFWPSWWQVSGVLYPILGAFGCVVSFNEIAAGLPSTGLAAFWIGVACYFLQFLVWARHWPDPLPEVFGYREVQHAVLLCGTTLHSIVVLKYL